MIKTAYINIMETSVVSLSAGTADSSYPLYRLYDRNIGRTFRSTVAETIEILVDQGAGGNLAADRLLIPGGHNLDGMTLDIKYSDDDASYTPAVSQWVQSGGGLINKPWASITHRYWKFIITAPASVPEIAEIFLTATYEWKRDAGRRGSGPHGVEFNVLNEVTHAGHDRFLVRGSPKRRRFYHAPNVGEAQKENILALNGAWAGSAPFWLCDHEGAWIYGKLRGEVLLKEITYQRYSFDFDFMEVLP